MIRKSALLLSLLTLSTFSTLAIAQEVQTTEGAHLAITARTSFGWDIDQPWKYGLITDFPRLGLYYKMSPYQLLSNKVKSNDPIGFVEVSLYPMEIRFTNGSYPDDNNPNNKTNVGFGWNDPAKNTGYYAPIYLGGMRAGIAAGDWVVQLAAKGNYNAEGDSWLPWNRNLGYYRESVMNSWAYMESRVQYQRDPIPANPSLNPTAAKDGITYDIWKIRNVSSNPDFDSLSQQPASGDIIGVQYNGTEGSFLIKVGTEYPFSASQITPTNLNGISGGIDYAISPSGIKGFRILGSFTGLYNYGSDNDADPFMAGAKAGYDIPLEGMDGYSIEPYVGYDFKFTYNGANNLLSQEIAAGVTLHWPGAGGWGVDYIAEDPAASFPGVSLAYKLYQADLANASTPVHNVMLTLFENKGDDGALYAVGAELVADFFDLSGADTGMRIEVSSYLDANLVAVGNGWLVPWTKIYYDNLPDTAGSRKNGLKVDLGVKLDKAITNTVLGLDWESRNLTDPVNGSGFGVIKLSAEVNL